MKQFFLLIIAALLFTTQIAAGKVETVTEDVLTSFRQEFGNDTKAEWHEKDGIYTASFKMDNRSLQAYFNEEGGFLGIGEFSSLSRLPYGVKLSIEKKFKGSTIHQVYEFSAFKSSLIYGFLISDARKIRFISMNGDGDITVIKVQKKKNYRY